ncbi:hypothetical protein BDZ89DRAFT_1081293 [Hymenopellis radicata]|nr:hypothetical protein BDZ89DRAFT_1081293 [Hymenopellis radicata]
MFPSAILHAAIVVVAASAARATIYQICAICPRLTSLGTSSSLEVGFTRLLPPSASADQGADGPITRCVYDNSGVFVSGTEYCPPGPLEVAVPPNCTTASDDSA